MRLLGAMLDAPTRRDSTNCDTEVITQRKAVSQGKTTDLVTDLHRETVSSYVIFSRVVDGVLVDVSIRLKKTFNGEAQNLQQRVHHDVREAAEKLKNRQLMRHVQLARCLK